MKTNEVEIGNRYDCWVVLSKSDRKHYYLCKCDCGAEKEVRVFDLGVKSKMCKNCASEVSRRGHGGSTKYKSEYSSWLHMISRCTNPNDKDYPNYGGRGIKVDPLWIDSFEVFLMMMGEKPEPKSAYTIDRVSYEGNYEPNNCQWANSREQNLNKSDNVNLTLDGETKAVSEWVEDPRCVVSDKTLYKRIARGWDAKKAITTPVKGTNGKQEA